MQATCLAYSAQITFISSFSTGTPRVSVAMEKERSNSSNKARFLSSLTLTLLYSERMSFHLEVTWPHTGGTC